MKQKNFWQKNQVFISGLASALIISLQQFIMQPEGGIDWKAIGLAAAVAIASYFGNELRGKGVSVAGFLGIAGTTFATVQSTGHFTWSQFGLLCMVGFLALIAPPPKDASYEQSQIIEKAKSQGAVIKEMNKETPPPQL